MFLRLSLCLFLLIALPLPAAAQAPPADAEGVEPAAEPDVWAPRSGDAWLDTWLADVNLYAERYGAAFADELVRYRGAPRALVEQLVADPAWQPADVYVACALAQALGRTCREVAAAWRRNPGAGWAALAETLDDERHGEAMARVKRGLVESYDRWARPIRLDAALRRAFPERER
ncbi:hypothetical protein CMZ82_11970 [Lysobacteraceae bacterium NML93-0792]|nr:hypothetical protein CMZ82_11970 [Xanthomonadaceae bacterium NML93-0792]PBS14945.1 hypothetical protein CMZ81_13275 [Xanthomonadaceae bacterium NML93-0793]PBS18696.1 hypothetical protein CMZ80_10395 [Xanthomonadaceae bacterium NML93-0831]